MKKTEMFFLHRFWCWSRIF